MNNTDSGNPLRILHIEDSPRDAEIIRERLIDAGFSLQLDLAANEQQFTAFLHSGGYDLILADYQMFNFEAPAALNLAKTLCPGVPFICVSGSIGEEKAVELLKQGATDYVLKDKLDKLPLTIQRALDEVQERTARQLAEDELRKNEERFKAIVQTSIDGFWSVDMDGGTFLEVNDAYCAMSGYTRDALLSMCIADIEVVESPEQVRVHMDRLAAQGGGRFESVHRCADGSVINVQISSIPLVAQSMFICFVSDITERRHNEEKMRKLSQAVEQSPVSIVITDTTGVIEFVNPAFTHLTGYEADEAIGQNPRILKSGKISSEVYQKLWSTITSGNVWEGELYNKKKNGELFWEGATISPIKTNEGIITHYLAIKEDITDKKNLKEQLLQSQKMEAIGQLAGGVAHDFNNILTVIIGYCSMLNMKSKFDSAEKEALEHISSAAEKATQLTQGLLAFSRKQVMDTKPANLNAVLQHVQKFLVRIIGEDIILKAIYNDATLRVMADAGQIEQVLINLATNARDAMPKGGSLTIETALQHIDDSFVSCHGWGKPGRYALISVSDTGAGMDEETRGKIFEPFFTTKEVGKGTGLGMAIVHGIVTQHNGFIDVSSEQDKGTTFKIYIPLIGKESASDKEEFVAEPPKLGTETILVVEDNDSVRNLVEKVLTNYGYDVISADDGQDAVDTFKANREKVQLILMDMILPKKSGMEAYKEIQHLQADIKVLFTSGYTADFIRCKGDLDKDADLIMKPAKPLDLLNKVREVLDRHT